MVIEPNLALSVASENTYNNCADKLVGLAIENAFGVGFESTQPKSRKGKTKTMSMSQLFLFRRE